MKRLLFALIIAALPVTALADGEKCWLVATVAPTSIAAGAIVTSALTMAPGSLLGGAQSPLPSHVKVGIDLVDANGSVTDITLTFTASEASDSYRKPGATTAGVGTALYRSWNPQILGVGWISNVPWKYPLGIITITPTGHGAGDTVGLAVYGCTGTP